MVGPFDGGLGKSGEVMTMPVLSADFAVKIRSSRQKRSPCHLMAGASGVLYDRILTNGVVVVTTSDFDLGLDDIA
jgi:hypothetical protein